MVKKSTALKSICNAKSNEPIAQSVKNYVTLPRPCISKLIRGPEENKIRKRSQTLE
jgi:hypothetical protein